MFNQFFEDLEKCADQFEWYIGNGYLRGFQEGKCFCPITAVHYHKTREYIPPHKAPYIIDTIFYLIINAADNLDSELEPYKPIIRRLLKAIEPNASNSNYVYSTDTTLVSG